ncbi:hypothetical protein DPPLL_28140 [Desulfofustis limnaeus]|uniref:Uncharacterized protein n=1 Tax=Desulfofustis limnaeus TaxID=2740163 RepID=A0ABM7WBW3_9BACT|nr:hypothetical protein DPPLL_28140 [Desulfofustis limnaeus]
MKESLQLDMHGNIGSTALNRSAQIEHKFEQRAKSTERELWGGKDPIPPWECRTQQRDSS